MPVRASGQAPWSDAKAVTRRQQPNPAEEAAGGFGIDEDEGGGEHLFVDALVDAGKTKQALGLGREGKEVGALVVAERALSGMIAGGE